MLRNPGPDLVVSQWLRAAFGNTEMNIANSIPRDESGTIDLSAWGNRKTFVTGLALPGGVIDLGTQDGSFPAVIDCWARPENTPSNKVPWERAAAVAELIRQAAESDLAYVELSMPNTYKSVLMDGVEMTMPARVNNDPLRFARYNFTMRFYYAVKD